MNQEKGSVSTYSQVLLWFGAAVSIAEIMTGALIAPLGLGQGILAILIGHVIGALILYPAGLIGAVCGLSSAQSVRISFGKYGSFGFSIVNLLQLVGWTAIMILSGASAMNTISYQLWNYQNEKMWCVVIGLLIGLWVFIGVKNLSKINTIVMAALFICTLILGYTVFKVGTVTTDTQDTMSFSSAVELNVTMSLSWLPLISDYTRNLKKAVSGTVGSVLGYFGGSVLMFIIGLGAAIYAGTSDISVILLTAGLGLVGMIIVVFSTVTTTFLDVYSAGVSVVNIVPKVNEKAASLVVCVVGVILAIFASMEQYEDFLYLIGSVFAPLFSILFADYFLLHRTEVEKKAMSSINLILWVIGFVTYRILMNYNSVIGITLPIMIVMGILTYVVNKVMNMQ